METFLNEYPNFEMKVVDEKNIINEKFKDQFHPKGYIFEYEDHYKILIGSVNMTESAMKTNVEWSFLVESKKDDIVTQNVLDEFEYLWSNVKPLTKEFIEKYREDFYKRNKLTQSLKMAEKNKEIKPNTFQIEALENLNNLRNNNQNKALIIAATGIGKTFLSAFDVLQFKSNKTLFVVHRDEILLKSKETFEKVIKDKTMSIFKAQDKNTSSDIIFASQATLHRNLNLFKPDEFDYIIIDEAHHAGASTYLKVIEYFKPNFLLGMTATPERMDGINIWELFGNNIAIEKRLKDAIKNDLVTTFHYFGISDLNEIEINESDMNNLDKLAKKLMIIKRVDYILEQINTYKYDGEKMYCIGFCANINHAKYMSEEFNKRGIVSSYLISTHSRDERQNLINRFQNENDPLQVLFVVDIFNEGVDIPKINLVLFLRPTNSPIIFIQQLGRGLRKIGDKKFLTVLDFISNYNKSFLIPYTFASFNNVINELYVEDIVKKEFKNFPEFHIQFDEISKERILNSLSKNDFNSKKWMKYEYQEFKKIRDNKIPYFMCDYLVEGAPDVLRIINKYKNYLNFLWNIEHDVELFKLVENEKFLFYINYLCNMLPIVRINEFIVLFNCINSNKKEISYNEIKEIINLYCKNTEDWSIQHTFKWFNGEFWNKDLNDEFNKYIKYKIFETEELNKLVISKDFEQILENEKMKKYIIDCLEFGIQKYVEDFKNQNYCYPFLKIGYKYPSMTSPLCINKMVNFNSLNRKGMFKIEKNEYKGYFIFITFNKGNDVKTEWNFNDSINSRDEIIWETPNETSQKSETGQNFINHKVKNINIHVFVRKLKQEPFIYLGLADVTKFEGNNPIRFKLKLRNKMSIELFYELK